MVSSRVRAAGASPEPDGHGYWPTASEVAAARESLEPHANLILAGTVGCHGGNFSRLEAAAKALGLLQSAMSLTKLEEGVNHLL